MGIEEKERRMKKLCRKGKVQVHPSPNTAACRDAFAVLRLLPVAIAALSATLLAEDREVLAYFIARSLDVPDKETKKNKRGGGGATPRKSAIGRHGDADEEEGFPPWAGGGGAAAAAASSSSFTRFEEADSLLHRSPSSRGKEAKNNRKTAAPSQRSHRISFECSCFQCYMSFWSRWDASPRREIIHQAIDLFEEHLATEAEATKARKSRKGSKPGKDDKNGNNNPKTLHEAKEKDEVFAVPDVKNERDEDLKPAARSKQIVPFDFEEETEENNDLEDFKGSEKVEEIRAGACPLEGRSLMRRMFPDIMGFVADHLWTAWSSPIRASNA